MGEKRRRAPSPPFRRRAFPSFFPPTTMSSPLQRAAQSLDAVNDAFLDAKGAILTALKGRDAAPGLKALEDYRTQVDDAITGLVAQHFRAEVYVEELEAALVHGGGIVERLSGQLESARAELLRLADEAEDPEFPVYT
jgi:hypothetical protein